jgi:hypothetical protein
MTFAIDTILISEYLKDRVPFKEWEPKHQRLLSIALFPEMAKKHMFEQKGLIKPPTLVETI